MGRSGAGRHRGGREDLLGDSERVCAVCLAEKEKDVAAWKKSTHKGSRAREWSIQAFLDLFTARY